MIADTDDTRLHERWAAECGGTAERRKVLATYLTKRIQQPYIESQSSRHSAFVAELVRDSNAWLVAHLTDAEVAAWLAHAGLGPSFEAWMDARA